MNGHEMLWLCQRLEAELGIETMSVTGREQQASQSLKVGMRKNRSHQKLGDPSSPVFGNHKNVANVRHRRKVGRDTGKPYLTSVVKGSKSQRVLDGAFNHVTRDASRPIGVGEKPVDKVEVEARRVGGNLVFSFKVHADCEVRDAA